MQIQCPLCKDVVPGEQVNMSADLAFCPRCNEGFAVSESIDVAQVNADVLANPPRGAWFREEVDGMIIGASTRSPIAFFLVPFMCVWSGFSLGGIYGSQIASGEFDLARSLFGIPFILGSILFWSLALMAVCGKVEVAIARESGVVFVGLGKLGWKRRFDWSSVKAIREAGSDISYPGGWNCGIVLEGQERLKFGTNLNERRRYFLLNALKYLRSKTCR